MPRSTRRQNTAENCPAPGQGDSAPGTGNYKGLVPARASIAPAVAGTRRRPRASAAVMCTVGSRAGTRDPGPCMQYGAI